MRALYRFRSRGTAGLKYLKILLLRITLRFTLDSGRVRGISLFKSEACNVLFDKFPINFNNCCALNINVHLNKLFGMLGTLCLHLPLGSVMHRVTASLQEASEYMAPGTSWVGYFLKALAVI